MNLNSLSKIYRKIKPHPNAQAVLVLKHLGFPESNIRSALSKITGITHKDVALKIGKGRTIVTRTLSGGHRNAEDQALVAEVYNVPKEILFEDIPPL